MAFDFSSIASMAGSSGGSMPGGGSGTKGYNLRENFAAKIASSQNDVFSKYLAASNSAQQITKEQPNQTQSPAIKQNQGDAQGIRKYVDTAKMIQSIVNGNQQQQNQQPENLTGQTPTVATVEVPVVQEQPTHRADK